MTYPKLPGPPTEPGLYEITKGEQVEYARLHDTGHVLSTRGSYIHMPPTWADWTWRGPIPPPQTGERKPAKGWEKSGAGMWILRACGRKMEAEVEPITDHRIDWDVRFLGRRVAAGDTRNVPAAIFAAEDALRQVRDEISNALGDSPAEE